MSIASTNPATGQQLKTFSPLTDDLLQNKILEADQAFLAYRQTSWTQRSTWLHRAAEILRDEQQSLAWAKLMTLEMGKPIEQAIAEVQKCASVCDYYADHGAELLTSEQFSTDASQSWVEYQPLGVILAVMPWNFPFWQVFRFAAPTLMAGNVALLKHASNVPQCAIAIEDISNTVNFRSASGIGDQGTSSKSGYFDGQ
jgi:succinate-semialdehyde dehydrogenase / glutarate-semialdehyde dehydrogenase